MHDLTPDLIRASLAGRFGSDLRVLETTGSTNADALAWADEGAPEGAVVSADQQTVGRGRHGRSWMSEPGHALLFSFVLRPRLGPDLPLLSTAVGVGACEALRRATKLSVLLKWPNDLVVEDRKLAGILVETRSAPDGAVVAVAGMGVNVSWAPDGLSPPATSISKEMQRSGLGPSLPRPQLLGALLTGVERRYDQLTRGDAVDLVITAESLSSLVGREVEVRLPGGESVTGMVTGLSRAGALEVESASGPRTLTVGEVETVRST